MNFELRENADYIELTALLKALRIAQTGGHAKIMVENGEVSVNGVLESRKRAKIKKGDIVEVNKMKINVI